MAAPVMTAYCAGHGGGGVTVMVEVVTAMMAVLVQQ